MGGVDTPFTSPLPYTPAPDHAMRDAETGCDTLSDCSTSFAGSDLETAQLLPDGGYSRRPDQVCHREAFSVEAGWLSGPDRLERLVRYYDASGAWLSACHEQLNRHVG